MFDKEAEELIQKNIKLNKTPRETVYEAFNVKCLDTGLKTGNSVTIKSVSTETLLKEL